MATYTKLPSGNWRVQVRREGFYKSKSFPRKREAETWATRVEAEIRQSDAGLISSSKLLSELIETYIQQTPRRGRSWANYLAAWQSDLGHVPVSKLRKVHIQDWIDRKLAQGTSAVTIAGYLSSLARVLDWARHTLYLQTSGDLCREARRALTQAGHRTRSATRYREPSDGEIALLRGHWDTRARQKIPMAEIVDFALASAMRQAEICRIRFEDVNWQNRTVIIRDRKDPAEKIGNDQEVPLVGSAWEILSNRASAGEHSVGRIFPYNSRSVSAAFARAVTHLGIDDLRFHDLRHAAITNLFRMGLDIPMVAICSGHKDWKNLKRYTELTAVDVHARLERIGNE